MKLHETIRARRMALHMTQQELAARLGYKSTSTIAKIEAGVNDIPQSKIIAFARALATTPGALLSLGNERCGVSEKNISQSLLEKNVSLTDQERALIEKYRKLNEAGKEYIEAQLDFALGRGNYKRKASPAGEAKGVCALQFSIQNK